jgi:hypothetical protein
MEDLYQFDEEYRDSIATVDAKGEEDLGLPKESQAGIFIILE